MTVITLPARTFTGQTIVNQQTGAKNGDVIDGRNAVFIHDSCRKAAHNHTLQVRGWDDGTLRFMRGWGLIHYRNDDRTRCYQGKFGNSNGGFITVKDCNRLRILDTFFGKGPERCGWDGIKLNGNGPIHVERGLWLWLYDDVSDNHQVGPMSWKDCWWHSFMGAAVEDRGRTPQVFENCVIDLFQIYSTNQTKAPHIQNAAGLKWQGSAPFIAKDFDVVVYDGRHRTWDGAWKDRVGRAAELSGECRILDLSHTSRHGGRWDHPTHGFRYVAGKEAELEYAKRKHAFAAIFRRAGWGPIWPDWQDLFAMSGFPVALDAHAPDLPPEPDPPVPEPVKTVQLPVTLGRSTPDPVRVVVRTAKPVGATGATLSITGYDLDGGEEAVLVLNDEHRILLFGDQVKGAGNNNRVATVTYDVPPDAIDDGDNDVLLQWLTSGGCRIDALEFGFSVPAAPPPPPDPACARCAVLEARIERGVEVLQGENP